MAKLILAGSAALMTAGAVAAEADYPIHPVPFTKVRFTSGVLADRQYVNRKVTIPFALQQCLESGRLKNFDLAAETMKRRAAGETTFQNRPASSLPFDDTDIYKFLEGASYSLQTNPDPELQKKMEDIIQHVKAAQEPDGYLYTFRTMHPDSPAHEWINQKRWLNDPNLSHELYNLGHFYECATAYFEATGDRTLLDMAVKSAELVNKDLGGDDPCIAPGHQIIEMGLAKLYRQTGDPRWLKLAAHFLENKAKRGPGDPYSQSHKPVLQQDEAVGHAVRANYMYAGMADVAALSGDQRYIDAITKIWDNVVGKKYHLTGGCGARSSGEAYGNNYELPNRCYNETCAAVAFLFWTHRMFLMYGDAKYMDTFERTMYNGAFSGVSLSGDRFFYPNLLESSGSERSAWFGCACCPPNIMRTIASLGQYVCAKKDNTIYMLLYGSGTVDAGDAVFTQTTNYPWDGKVEIALSDVKQGKFALALRIPGWAEGHPVPSDLYTYTNAAPAKWTLLVNGKKADYKMNKGFAVIDRTWKNGDKVTLDLPMEVRRVKANEQVGNLTGQVAFERGPIVFAFEQKDQGVKTPWRRWSVAPDAKVEAKFRTDLFPGGGVETLEIDTKDGKMTAIPYAWWANRGSMPMRVWLSDSDAATTYTANKSEEAKVSVSYARGGMNPAAINDGFFPQNPTDIDIENFDFWSHLGGSEWAMLTFEEPVELTRCKFYWFDDSRRGGGCALPQSWTLSYDDGSGQFVPVEASEQKMDEITFKPVKAKRLRLDIRQRNRMASGLYEWLVFNDSRAEIGEFSEAETALFDSLETGSFSFAGISRDYMLYMPKNADGTEKRAVPLMVWNIGGGEYGMDIKRAAAANRAIVCMNTAGVDCAVLVFALNNPNYEYSASLYPEKLMQIDRNNALQAAFIQTLIKAGRINGEHVYCAGASSGGGATVRFCMQFPELFAVAVPCCSMDPIVPIHKVKEQYEGQFVHDMKAAFRGQVYRWNGTEMALDNIDTEAFLSLPMAFVHAREDIVCKVASSLTMFEARRELGAAEDMIRIYEHDEMAAYGIQNRMLAHLSWVPLLSEFGEGTPMSWMLGH